MPSLHIANIHPHAFCHPDDRKATDALKKVPLLPEIFRWVSRLKVEERARAHYMNHAIRLGPQQLPSLWLMVHEVAEGLGMSLADGKVTSGVEVYVSGDTYANAFAFGVERHTVVLTNGLVDMMTDAELKAIITHEFAHVLCRHMLYRNVGLALVGGAVGLSSGAGASRSLAKLLPSRIVNETISGLLYAWWRAAEYSADRAALLVLGDPEPLASSLSRLAGLPRRYASEFDLRLFAEQAKNYEETSTLWSKVITYDMRAFQTHPEPARRAVAILEWARSDEFRRIQAGQYLTQIEGDAEEQLEIEGVTSCSLCGRPVGVLEICPGCGLLQDPDLQEACPRGHPNTPGWKHCKSCGLPLSAGTTHSETPES